MLVMLAADTSPELTPWSAATGVAVALLALGFAALAWRAGRRRENPRLRLVAAAFAVFAAKNVFSAYNVYTHTVPHDAIELVLSLFDLAAMSLLFLPFVLRRS